MSTMILKVSDVEAIEFEKPKHVYRVWVDLGGERPYEAFFTSKEKADDYTAAMTEAGHQANMNAWAWKFMIEK